MEIRELEKVIDVYTVSMAISSIYSRFGDPLKDKDSNLERGIDYLQKYCLSKKESKILTDIRTTSFDDRPEFLEKDI